MQGIGTSPPGISMGKVFLYVEPEIKVKKNKFKQ